MTEVTQLLQKINAGDGRAQDELYSIVYGELKKIAANRLSSHSSENTFQSTELVHEAYLRLTTPDGNYQFENRAHFFGAAAEAMRRIVVDRIRFNARQKRGGDVVTFQLPEDCSSLTEASQQVLDINEAIDRLDSHDAMLATLVKLRFFVGMKHQEAADAMGISRRKADRLWTLARAWLYHAMHQDD